MYFVPSWYHGNEYKENEQYFYVRRAVTEFDDSVKQISCLTVMTLWIIRF